MTYPYDLITVSIDLCLRAGVALLALLSIVIVYSSALVDSFKRSLNGPDRGYNRLRTLIFFGIAVFLTLSMTFRIHINWFVFFLLVGFGLLLLIGLIRKANSSGNRSLFTHIQEAAETEDFSKLFSFANRIFQKPLLVVLIVSGIILVMAHPAGYATARDQKNFLITSSGDKILLRTYGDHYIFKGFDPAKNAVLNKLMIFNSDEVAKHELKQVTMRKAIIRAIEELPDPEPTK